MVWKQNFAMCKLWAWPWVNVMLRLSDTLYRFHRAVRSYDRDTVLCMYALWPWPWRCNLASWWWHALGSWTISVWNIIQIQRGSEELWPGRIFSVYVHCDLHLRDMTLGQGHDTLLGHEQQLCEILSRFNLAVRSYGPDTDFGNMCTVTFNLEIWPWVKVVTRTWIMDNNCAKYYPDAFII